MPGEWATIVPMQSADPRLRVTPAANVAPKISDRDVENSAAGPRATGTQCVSAIGPVADRLHSANI
jgi:hypothetical protein